jgi:hypothetical protein
MGNASASVIVKKYDGVPKEHTASAGHLLNWKIWPGICKDSNTSLGQTCLLLLNLFLFVNVLYVCIDLIFSAASLGEMLKDTNRTYNEPYEQYI